MFKPFRWVWRYAANLLHGCLVHPLLALTYPWSPAWLLRWHDTTAFVAWPDQLKGYLPNGDLLLIKLALDDARGNLLGVRGPGAEDAIFLIDQALSSLPASTPERFDW